MGKLVPPFVKEIFFHLKNVTKMWSGRLHIFACTAEQEKKEWLQGRSPIAPRLQPHKLKHKHLRANVH